MVWNITNSFLLKTTLFYFVLIRQDFRIELFHFKQRFVSTVASESTLYSLYIPRAKSHVNFPFFLTYVVPRNPFKLEALCKISLQAIFLLGEELLAPRPTPKPEDHPLPAVRD
jgi:hypothetical protein